MCASFSEIQLLDVIDNISNLELDHSLFKYDHLILLYIIVRLNRLLEFQIFMRIHKWYYFPDTMIGKMVAGECFPVEQPSFYVLLTSNSPQSYICF